MHTKILINLYKQKQMKKTVIIVGLTLLVTGIFAQGKKVSVISFEKDDSYDITQDLPSGYVRDGSVDYSSIIQTAMNKHLHVVLPSFPVGLFFNTPSALIPNNGQVIDCPVGCQIKMIPNGQASKLYGFFKLVNVHDVTINNINLVGDLGTHLAPVIGDGGNGIYIFGGRNIKINHGIIKNCTGDGIYIGRSSTTNSSNIIINGTDVSRNGRNGISLTSGVGILLNNPIANFEEYNSPYCGIDVEPSDNGDNISNVVINNPICLNTPQTAKGGIITLGISIGLKRFYQKNPSLNISDKVTNITINNPIISGSVIGLKASLSTIPNASPIKISGRININNPSYSNNFAAGNSVGSVDTNLVINTYNPTATDSKGVKIPNVINYLAHNSSGVGSNVFISSSTNPKPITSIDSLTIDTPRTIKINSVVVDTIETKSFKNDYVKRKILVYLNNASGIVSFDLPHNFIIEKVSTCTGISSYYTDNQSILFNIPLPISGWVTIDGL